MTDAPRGTVLRRTWPWLTVALAVACQGTNKTAPGATARDTAAKGVTFVAATWRPPTEADIPNDSLGAAIRRGLYLLRFTPESLPAYATSNLRCTSCHQNDGTKVSAAPLTGAHGAQEGDSAQPARRRGPAAAQADVAAILPYALPISYSG